MSPKPKMMRAGWYDSALTEIEKLARKQRFMTSDDVHEALGDLKPPHFNAMGAVMNEAVSQNIIKPTGRVTHSTRPSAKGRNIQIHESCLYAEVDTIENYIKRHEDDGQLTFEAGA